MTHDPGDIWWRYTCEAHDWMSNKVPCPDGDGTDNGVKVPCATQERMLWDVPAGTMRLTPGVDNIWLIFRTAADRAAYAEKYFGTWMVTGDRAAKLDYHFDWPDVHGFGLELAQFHGPGTQGHRMRQSQREEQRHVRDA